jgi:hypothetical protein
MSYRESVKELNKSIQSSITKVESIISNSINQYEIPNSLKLLLKKLIELLKSSRNVLEIDCINSIQTLLNHSKILMDEILDIDLTSYNCRI